MQAKKGGATMANPQKRRASAKGQRPKHTPQRMCISCREKTAKRTLIRIVRTPEGSVEIDSTGKKNGRGAYLCDDPACWNKALDTNSLDRALKTTINDETIQAFRRHAATFPPTATQAAAVETPEGINS